MSNIDVVRKEMETLQKAIDQAVIDKASSDGKVSTLTDRLKKEHGQSTIAAAEKKLQKDKATENTLRAQIITKFKELKDEYEF